MYDLEEQKIINKINENKYKLVLLQLPDGLKTRTKDLVPTIEKATNATIVTWFGSNFGACDLPVGLQVMNFDLIVAFGHNVYVKEREGW